MFDGVQHDHRIRGDAYIATFRSIVALGLLLPGDGESNTAGGEKFPLNPLRNYAVRSRSL